MAITKRGTYEELTQQEEIFCQALVIQGKTQRQAFLTAYPEKVRITEGSQDKQAFFLAHKGKIVARCSALTELLKKNGDVQSLWTREDSIEKLTYVIDKNQAEIERIEAAHDEETAQLLAEYESTEDEAEQAKIAKDIIAKMKKRRMTNVHNMGITQAVAELNKMQGFNETTVNMNEKVTFTGEDELPD